MSIEWYLYVSIYGSYNLYSYRIRMASLNVIVVFLLGAVGLYYFHVCYNLYLKEM